MRIIFSPKCLEYSFPGHPESPERISSTAEFLKGRFDFIEPGPCTESQLLAVHTKGLVEKVRTGGYTDFDTPWSPEMFGLARLSAGGAIKAAEMALKEEAAFSLMRPPGHHAGRDFLGGFCYFNSMAIAVRYLQKYCSIKKVVILDIDSHAGNGTMAIFWDDKSVLYISLHQYPSYPGIGWINETGGDSAKGFTLNIPLNPHTGDDFYLQAIKKFAIPVIKEFNPEVIGVSAGFDTYKSDPITNMNISLNSYYRIGKFLKNLNKRTFLTLEGGYDIKKLPWIIFTFLSSLENMKIKSEEEFTISSQKAQEENLKRFNLIKDVLSKYWSI